MKLISYLFLVWVVIGLITNVSNKDLFVMWLLISIIGVWIGWTQYQSIKRLEQFSGKEWNEKQVIPENTSNWKKPFVLMKYLFGWE